MLGSPTLGELKTSLQARGYATDTAAQQVEFINTAYRRVLNARRYWPFLAAATTFPTVAGTSLYTVSATDAATFDAVRLLDPSSNLTYEVDFKPRQELETLVANNSPAYNDTPDYWTRRGDQIQLWPAPNKVYTVQLDYTSHPAKLVNDADTLVIPRNWVDVVLWASIVEIATRQRDWQTAGQAEARYQAELASMVRMYGSVQAQTARTVEQWDGWDEVER